jgi:hypothetical protein
LTGARLGKPLQVWFTPPGGGDCRGVRTHFAASDGGTVSPDTAYGTPVDGKCKAETTWRLGSTLGEQSVVARIVRGSDRERFTAVGRPRAKLSGGLVWSSVFLGERNKDAFTETAVKGTYQYVDTLNGRAVTVTRDTTLDTKTSQIKTPNFDPVVGIEFTLAHWRWSRNLRLFFGVSAVAPTERFFAGLNPLAWLPGHLTEGSPVSVYAGASLYRPKTADGRRNIWSGPTFMLVVDGTSLLSAVAGAFK